MKKIIFNTLLFLITLTLPTGAIAQDREVVNPPHMSDKTDSLSYMMGFISGVDISEDFDVINAEIAAEGLLFGFMDNDDTYSGRAEKFLSDYTSVIHSDEIAESRARLSTLPDTHPQWIRKNSADYDIDTHGRELRDMLVSRYSECELEIPQMSTIEDSMSFYRGVLEGRFFRFWLEEVQLDYAVHGMVHGFLVDREEMDYDKFYNYSIRNLSADDTEPEYYGYGEYEPGNIHLPEYIDVPQLENLVDSAAYYFGVYMGGTTVANAPELSHELFRRGLDAGFMLGEQMPEDALESLLSYYFDDYRKEIIRAQQTENARQLLDSLSALPGFSVTDSGLIYRIIDPGDTHIRIAHYRDRVELDYTIGSLDGKIEMGSDYDDNEPNLGDLPEGIYEGLKMIGRGGNIELYFGPSLSDDADGYPNDYDGAVFHATLHLKDIAGARQLEAARQTLDSLSALPGFSVTDSGLVYRIIDRGDEEIRVMNLYDSVELEYTIECLNGDIEISFRHQESEPELRDMLQGLYEGLKMVGRGGSIELYFGPNLSNDADGYPNDYEGAVFHATISLLDVVNN